MTLIKKKTEENRVVVVDDNFCFLRPSKSPQ